MPVRVLLFQARQPDDPMKEHERRCFVDRTGLPPEALVPHDLLDGPPTVRRLRRFDALMVGGSGEFYVSEGNLPEFDRLLDFLLEVIERGHPTFASCFGYQCMIVALGGEIVRDPSRAEVGTYELTLTEAGSQDELFGDLPPRLPAQMGHRECANRRPDNIPNLAASKLCSYQALRIPGKPIWASQFHPELTRETTLDRYERYLEAYSSHMSEAERKVARSRFKDSPEASSLLGKFLDLVFG